MKKTNASRILERMGIDHTLVAYEVTGEEDIARKAAASLGVEADAVFKTLVTRGDKNGPLFAVLPASCVLDLKALARASGDRRVEMVPLTEVERLTGYVRGAVTALGAKKAFPVFLDETAQLFERLGVSAGAKGLELMVGPADFLRATGGQLAPIGVYRNPK